VLAAALLLLAVVLVLGIGTQLIVLTNGGGHELPLFKTFVLIAANQLTQMLIILVLSVLMNNIVAAIIGVVIVQVTKLIGFAHVVLHIFVDHGQAVTSNLRVITTVVDVIYWTVPRYLDSDLTREVYAGAQATRGDSALSTINVSGPFDVAYWFAWVAVLFILLTWVLQRREV
jgi:ABC-type transport system involved in multi-copper enzyme maturation permease subunit